MVVLGLFYLFYIYGGPSESDFTHYFLAKLALSVKQAYVLYLLSTSSILSFIDFERVNWDSGTCLSNAVSLSSIYFRSSDWGKRLL